MEIYTVKPSLKDIENSPAGALSKVWIIFSLKRNPDGLYQSKSTIAGDRDQAFSIAKSLCGAGYESRVIAPIGTQGSVSGILNDEQDDFLRGVTYLGEII